MHEFQVPTPIRSRHWPTSNCKCSYTIRSFVIYFVRTLHLTLAAPLFAILVLLNKFTLVCLSDMCITQLQHAVTYQEIHTKSCHLENILSAIKMSFDSVKYTPHFIQKLRFLSIVLYYYSCQMLLAWPQTVFYQKDTWMVLYFSHILVNVETRCIRLIQGQSMNKHVENLFLNDKIRQRYHPDVINFNTCIRHKPVQQNPQISLFCHSITNCIVLG